MFDYFMGGKKSDEIMEENKMKREEMAMLKNGNYLLDKDLPAMKKKDGVIILKIAIYN